MCWTSVGKNAWVFCSPATPLAPCDRNRSWSVVSTPWRTIPMPRRMLDCWVLANGNLQMVRFDKYRQKLVPLWNRPLTLGSPLHDSQVDEKNKTLFTVTQSLNRQACLATAATFEDGQVRWQRQLGMVCQ